MLKTKKFSVNNTKATVSSLPGDFGGKVDKAILAQALRVYTNREHPGYSKVKTRSEVKASTRKIYRQKGTGRARHGAISAPIFVGGGIAHGPKGVKRLLSLSKNQAKAARQGAVSLKVGKDQLFIVDNIDSINKTKQANKFLNNIFSQLKINKGKPKITIFISEENQAVRRYFRNIENVEVIKFDKMNAHNLYLGGLILVDNNSFKKTTKKSSSSEKMEKKSSVKKTKKVSVKSKKNSKKKDNVGKKKDK